VKSVKHVIMGLMLVALAIGVTAPQAAAQVGLKGTFSLPVEVYWGPAVLPAGQYTISMNLDASTGARLVFLDGEGVHTMILAGLDNPEEVSGRSTLQLEETNGVYVVRRLNAGVVGHSYDFLASKAARMKTERAGSSTPLTVPISASAGN
jgi:hypothetical protein